MWPGRFLIVPDGPGSFTQDQATSGPCLVQCMAALAIGLGADGHFGHKRKGPVFSKCWASVREGARRLSEWR